jgi:hypothetical protein
MAEILSRFYHCGKMQAQCMNGGRENFFSGTILYAKRLSAWSQSQSASNTDARGKSAASAPKSAFK